MNKSIKRIKIGGWTQKEWLEWRRMNGIGGSEVATVCGFNPYQSALELFYRKIEPLQERAQSQAAFFGQRHEAMIADVWQYWDGTPETMIENFNNGKVIRTCKRINSILQNPKTPYLFASVDRLFTKPKNGILEAKTISGYVEKQWKEGVPPAYIMQIQSYMLVSEYEYAEMAILSDGNRFQVLKFEADYDIMAEIARKCSDFWNRVHEARAFIEMELKEDDTPLYEVNGIQLLEPEPDGSEAWVKYLNEKMKSKPIEREGNFVQREWAEKYMACKELELSAKDDADGYKNQLCGSMREVERLSFGELGHVLWKPDLKGNRRFGVYLKKQKGESDETE